jgi:hypothetical protein
MQGVWENIMNSDSEKAFTIVKGNFSLNFVYNISAGLDFPLSESVEAFYDGDIEADSLNVSSLKADGLHYIVIDKKEINSEGWFYKPYYLSPNYFKCDGELMSINGGKLVEYTKIDELPFEALSKLYRRGKLDGRNYIKDYLGVKTRQVKPLKCKVYGSPDKPSKVQLKKDDVVIIAEETNKWVKVKYGEEEFGWIKKSDLK